MRLVLLGVFAAAIAMLVGLDSLIVRASIFPDLCYYRLARSVPNDVDVFLIGSSRMRRGVDPDQLAQLLGVPNLRVINFGHGGSTLDADYVLLDDLLPNRHVSLILVEASLDPNPEATTFVGFSSHSFTRYYLQLATFRQILDSPFIESNQPIVLRLYDMVNLLKAKIESEWRSVASGRVSRLYQYAHRRPMERPNICWHKQFEDSGPEAEQSLVRREAAMADLREAFYAEHTSWLDEGFLVPALFSDKRRRGQISLMRHIVKMAQARGARVAFINLPRYLGWPPGPDFIREFNQRIGAPLLAPDKGWLQQIQDNGYHDGGHMAGSGRLAYTAWLAQQLTANGLWDNGP